MLFKNKKFHFRVYFICTNINDEKNFIYLTDLKFLLQKINMILIKLKILIYGIQVGKIQIIIIIFQMIMKKM